jgi:prephenate dehydratase
MTFGFNTTHEAIQAVKDNKCQYAILPIENTVTGTFLATYDLLNDVYIAGLLSHP